MIQDLCSDIQLWREAGDHIVLMMDANEDVTAEPLTEALQAVGLREVIIEAHSDSGIVPTYQRGSRPIDGIFLSPSLSITKGGYLPFGTAPTDHRPLWIQIKYEEALGYTMDPLSSPSAR